MNTWQQNFSSVKSIDDLIGVTREYLASWSPDALARLPERCRPGRIKGVDDIFFWRDHLVGEYCAGAAKDDTESLIRALIAYFSAACEHAAALQGESDPLQTIPPLLSDKSIPRLFTSAMAGGSDH